MSGQNIELGHGHFLPNPVEFTVHAHPSTRQYTVPVTDSVTKSEQSDICLSRFVYTSHTAFGETNIMTHENAFLHLKNS